MPTEMQSVASGIETVVDLAVALSDFTRTPEQCREVPSLLGRTFGIDEVALAVVEASNEGNELVLCSLFSLVAGNSAPQTLESEMLSAHRLFRSQKAANDAHGVKDLHATYPSDTDGPEAETGRKAVIFARSIDREHDLLLMIRRRADSADFSSEVIDDLKVLANELAKQLYCMIAWHRCRSLLGLPFSTLTDSEWEVLGGLTTDGSEKQLASRLQMRPHTLHSRIKSIYHKLGVQGRLPLIQKYNTAVSQMRIEIHRPNFRNHIGRHDELCEALSA